MAAITPIKAGTVVPWPPKPPTLPAKPKHTPAQKQARADKRSAFYTEVAATGVAATAIIGSSIGLYNIGIKAHLAVPLSLPVAVDLLALVAAKAVQRNGKDTLSKVVLVGAILVSMVAQAVDSFPHGYGAMAVHLLLPLAGGMAFEVKLRIKARIKRSRPAPTKPTGRRRK